MDLQNFSQLALTQREKLYRFAWRTLGNAQDAEDAVQETLLRLWLMRAQLETYKNVSALAMTVTKNLCYDHLKRQKIRTTQQIQPQISKESIENTVERRQMMEMVHKVVETLPGLQQMIFRMKDIEGYEVEEIALITGTKAQAVRMNLSRARTRIREILDKMYNKYDAYE